jgi:hypothetical protein
MQRGWTAWSGGWQPVLQCCCGAAAGPLVQGWRRAAVCWWLAAGWCTHTGSGDSARLLLPPAATQAHSGQEEAQHAVSLAGMWRGLPPPLAFSGRWLKGASCRWVEGRVSHPGCRPAGSCCGAVVLLVAVAHPSSCFVSQHALQHSCGSRIPPPTALHPLPCSPPT